MTDEIATTATLYGIIIRHSSHPPGRWEVAPGVYDTRDQARTAAAELWAGTNVCWRLVTHRLSPPQRVGSSPRRDSP